MENLTKHYLFCFSIFSSSFSVFLYSFCTHQRKKTLEKPCCNSTPFLGHKVTSSRNAILIARLRAILGISSHTKQNAKRVKTYYPEISPGPAYLAKVDQVY